MKTGVKLSRATSAKLAVMTVLLALASANAAESSESIELVIHSLPPPEAKNIGALCARAVNAAFVRKHPHIRLVAATSVKPADVVYVSIGNSETLIRRGRLRPLDEWWLNPATGVLSYGAGPAMPGDANLDGVADDDDLSLVLANWGQDRTGEPDGGWGRGEFSGIAPVNDDDLSLILANWTAGSEVPEPASAMILLLGAWAVARRRR